MTSKSNSEKSPNRNPPPPERRSAVRFKVETSLEWRRTSDAVNDWKSCKLIDLSVGGAGFATAEMIPVGEQLKLRIASPRPEEKGRQVTVAAKVVNTRQTTPGEFRYGVQFSQIFFLFAEWANSNPTS